MNMNRVQKVSAQRVRAFTRLFETEYDRVLRFALRRVGNDADAADLAAETFQRAWEKCQQGETAPSAAWLFVTVRNVIGDHYRARARSARLADRLEEAAAQPAEDSTSGDAIEVALAALSKTDRELLELRYWDDLSVTEISRLLDVSPSALWVRLHRARKRFEVMYTQNEQRRTQ